MNEFKYQITQLVFILILGFGAYWALTNLDTGVSYSKNEIVSLTETDEPAADSEVNTVNNETLIVVDSNPTEEPIDEEVAPDPEPSESSNSELVVELEKLVDANVMLNSGSNGGQVKTVQEFLAVYFSDRTISIDSDFGPTTKNLVKEYQTKELNGGDGRVGPNTLQAMIDYLK